ncbi:MAG: site-specific integrase [Raineya sp.]|jgi:integrase|nr:site-specific integrase [Raineya sp.]
MKIGISFKKKQNKGSQYALIYAVICMNGVPKEANTGIKVHPNEWADGKPIGLNERFINEKLQAEKLKILEIFNDLLDKKQVNSEKIAFVYAELRKGVSFDTETALDNLKNKKKKIEDTQKQEMSIISILNEINQKKFKNKIIKAQNWEGNRCIIDKIRIFLQSKNLENIGYNKFKYTLFEELIDFLRFAKFSKAGITKIHEPRSNAHLRRIAQMVKAGNEYAIKRGYTETFLPQFDHFKDNAKETPFLTHQELYNLEKLDLSQDKYLDAIRDCFVFMAYTGFLFCDIKAFNPQKHLETDKEGRIWLIKGREKTGTKQMLPLLPKVQEIMDKWEGVPPLWSEPYHNETIKVLARQAGIKKHITNRVARKTAGMVWLNEGISLEVVSKMLGHKNVRITQKHYAQIQRERMAKETEHLMQPKHIPKETSQVPNMTQGNILESIAELVAQKLKIA